MNNNCKNFLSSAFRLNLQGNTVLYQTIILYYCIIMYQGFHSDCLLPQRSRRNFNWRYLGMENGRHPYLSRFPCRLVKAQYGKFFSLTPVATVRCGKKLSRCPSHHLSRTSYKTCDPSLFTLSTLLSPTSILPAMVNARISPLGVMVSC